MSTASPPRTAGRPALAGPPPGRRGRWPRRLVALLALITALALLAVAVGTAVSTAQDRLTETRAALDRAVDALRDGDVDASAASFAQAAERSGRATAALRSPPLRLVGTLPVLDRSVRSAVAVGEAADLVARSGRLVTEALAEVPGGLAGLAPDAAQLPTNLGALAEPLGRAEAMLRLARDVVADAAADTAVGEVDDARAELEQRLDEVLPPLRSVAALSRSLPTLLGSDRPRRYFLGAQNPAELRGTGGLIGAYAIMTIAGGAVDIGPFQATQTLPPDLLAQVQVSGREFLDRFREFISGEGSWLNVNMTPDFPTAATVLESLYREATGERLDGTILVDPFLLRSLLQATGPVEVAGVGTLQPETAVEFLVNQAPVALAPVEERKELLGEAAKDVLERFFAGGIDPQARVGALASAAGAGHLLVHSADSRVQGDLVEAGVAGELVAGEAGNLAVIAGNAGENKTDFYVDRTVSYDIFLNPDGSATGVIEVSLTNRAPTTGLPAYLIGPSPDLDPILDPGDNFTMLNVYCGPCEPLSMRYTDDLGRGSSVEQELEHTVLVSWELVQPGETQTTSYVVDLPGAWQRRGQRGVFAPVFDNQVTINPTHLDVRIHPPVGWVLRPQRDDITGEGGVAGWSGEPGAEERFPVELVRSSAPPWWQRIADLLP